MTTLNQLPLNAPYGNTMSEWLTYIENICSNMTVEETLAKLVELGFDMAVYRLESGGVYQLHNLFTVEEILDDYANDHLVEFMGGPPSDLRWYSGSLTTWLIDALMHTMIVSDGDLAMRILGDIEDIWYDDDEDSQWGESG